MADEYTSKLKVDISDLKKNITEANKEIKLANATFKSQTAGMENWTKDADGLSAKLKQLDTVLGSQKKVLSSYKSQLAAQQKAYDENGKRVEELKAKLKDLADNGVKKTDAEYQKYQNELKATVKEQKNSEKAVEDLKLKILNEEAAIGRTEKAITKYKSAENELQKENNSVTSTIDKQERELEQLRKEYIDVAAAQGKDSDQAKKLGDEIRTLSNELKDNKKKVDDAKSAADKFDNSLENASDKADKANSKFGGLKSTIASGLRSGLVKLAGAATTAAASMTAASLSAAKYADEINTLSAQTGIATDDLQAYKYAAELVDVPLETLTKSMAKNIKSMGNAKDGSEKFANAYKALGVQVTDANGQLRDSETVYWETIDALGKVKNETERDKLAMQLFGKSAQDLNPLIKAGADKLKGFTKEAKDMGAVMSKDNLNKLNELDDSMQKLKGGASAAKNALGLVLMPQLKTLADKGVKLLGKFTNGLIKSNGDWKDVGKLIGKSAGSFIGEAVNFIAENLPKLGDIVTSAVGSIGQNLIKNSPKMIGSASQFLQQIFKWAATALPKLLLQLVESLPAFIEQLDIGGLISSFAHTLSKIVDAIPEVAANLLKEMPQIVSAVVQGLLEGAVSIAEAALEMLLPIELSADSVTEELEKKVDNITSFADTLTETEPQLANYNKLISEQGNTISDLDTAIEKKEDEITNAIKDAIKKQGKLREDDVTNIEKYLDDLRKLESEKLGIYQQQQVAELRKVQNEAGSVSQKDAAQHLKNTQEALKKANDVVEEAYSTQIGIIESKYTEKEKKTSKAYRKEMNAAKKAHDEQIEENQGYYTQVLDILEKKSAEWVEKDSAKWESLRTLTKEFSTNSSDDFSNWINSVMGSTGKLEDVKKVYLENLNAMDLDGAQAFLNMTAQAKDSGAEIDQSTKEAAYNILANFDNLPDGLDETGKKTLLGMVSGMEKQIPKLKDASEMSSNEIVDTIKEYLGIEKDGESKETKEIGTTAGKFLGEGVKKGAEENADKAKKGAENLAAQAKLGLNGKKGDKMKSAGKTSGNDLIKGFIASITDTSMMAQVLKAVGGWASSILAWIKKTWDENSPSKITYKYGAFLAQGAINGLKGMTSKSVQAAKAYASSMLNAMDFGGLNSFATGLSQMNGQLATGGAMISSGGQVMTKNVTFNQTINAPKTPSRYELYRQTKNLISLNERGI